MEIATALAGGVGIATARSARRRMMAAVVGALLALSAGCDRGQPGSRPAPPASTPAAQAPPSETAPAKAPPDGSAEVETALAQVPPAAVTPGEAVPNSTPTSTGPTDPVDLPFRPLAEATTGEWAVYATADGRKLRYDVARVTGAAVTTRVTVYDQGKPLGLPALREDPRDYDLPAVQPAVKPVERRTARETIDVAGRSWNATLYETRWTDEGVAYVRRLWVSEEAPVFGLVRMELTGDGTVEARLELTAFGRESAGPEASRSAEERKP